MNKSVFKYEGIQNNQGFTLIELLLSIVLVSVLAGIIIPLYTSFSERNSLDVAAQGVVHSARRAQLLSETMAADSAWGFSVRDGQVVLFKGADYLSRDASYDEIFQISQSIIATGLSELTFEKFTGNPFSTGTLTLSLSGSASRDITINEKGQVSY